MNDKEVKSILVIGGSSSLGPSIINRFTNKNYKVFSTFFSSSESTNKELNFFLDLNNNNSILNFANKEEIKKAKFDVVIFLSGILPGKSIDDYSFDEIEEVTSINFTGIAKTFKSLKNSFANKSKIIFISSISATRGSYDPIYSASKGALISFMKSIYLWSNGSILTTAINPNLIDNSTMFNEMNKSRQDFHMKNSPNGKLTTIDEFSEIILDLVSSDFCDINGKVIEVNGGSIV